MTISRGQTPRQMYGLGSLVKKAVKGVTGAVKSIVKSPLGKAAILGAGIYGLGGGAGLSSLFGKAKTFMGSLPGASAIGDYLGTKGGKTLLMAGAGTLLGGLASKAEQGDPEAIAATRDVGSLKNYLFSGYKNLGYTDEQAQQLTDQDTAEYTSGQGAYATGGRVQYSDGSEGPDDLYTRSYKRVMELMDEGYDFGSAVKQYMKEEKERENKANGGRIGYAFGDVVDQASGIMGLPQRVNQAGVKELDLRKSGGFIPPVGVKEKADDIPAMLSNNEFVMTADSVRSMGEGNINKGAQRMYDMMKALENRIV